MEYIRKIILPDEQLLVRTRKAGYFFLTGILKELLILLMAGTAAAAAHLFAPSPVRFYLLVACTVVAAIALASFLLDLMRWRADVYVLTSRRVIHCSGIFGKRVLDSSLDKINDVILCQSWLGRLLGYGSIEILTASDQAINRIDRIARPIEFKRAMLKAKAGLEEAAAVPRDAVRSSPADGLRQLAELKNRALISPAEYEEKRAEILKRV